MGPNPDYQQRYPTSHIDDAGLDGIYASKEEKPKFNTYWRNKLGLRPGNFDTPDGENCLEKTCKSTFFGFSAGLWWSILEMIGRSKPQGIENIAARAARYSLPAAGMGAAYSTTACMAGAIRGKDGPLNHYIGGWSMGLVYATKFGWKGGMVCGGLMGIACCLTKIAIDSEVSLLPRRDGELSQFGPIYRNTNNWYMGPHNEYVLSEKDHSTVIRLPRAK